ncbi:platelet endothelial cell adhesion molecule isoform X3 [Sphaeramia orbicularis]|uniref:platelet endothelial cell adhesion molecule isoform X3 n=1 Tax=Sphaeramia orbicularis TaxID=375764 RepID=UPI00117DEECE|nr:platelet endothelial cell adhesion molecule-like isoform X3 [Sphaeramia orbicularis]
MGPLLLLTSTLLSSYLHPWRVVDAQKSFTIRGITLSVEPSTDVTRDTNVTIRCQAIVSSSGHQPLSREYTIYKDGIVVYTKTSSSSEDFLYQLYNARVSNTGKYMCKVTIEGEQRQSETKKLTVTGLSPPHLHINNGVISEGEELTASCTAPGETGSIIFYFYEGSKEKREERVNTNHVEVSFPLSSSGIHKLYCVYTILITPDSIWSEKSNSVTVTVRELPITPVLEIFPLQDIYEGDRLDIFCTVKNVPRNTNNLDVYLSQGDQLLSSGITEANHSMTALAKDSGEFECRLQMGHVVKPVSKKVSVTELFSVPTLTMSPAEVFQKEPMTLTCRSESFASERLRREELTYSLDPPESFLIPRGNGEFSGKALPYEFNYTCTAQAKGIVKHSKTLTVHPRVSVSTPRISVVGKAVLGRPFQIRCESDFGSLPINYTLLENYDPLHTVIVKQPGQQALFIVTFRHPGKTSKYMCEAKNSHKDGKLSETVDITAIEPLSQPLLTIIPTLSEIAEGTNLLLICSVKGTPPVTFKIYRDGRDQPLFTTNSYDNNTSFEIRDLSKEDSGKYYFEAFNPANNVISSEHIHVEVQLAMWKKVVIGGFCLLAVSVLVVVLALFFKSKRGKREAAAELSVKPSSPKSDDSLTVNLTHDTEVYNAATVKVNRTDSVWSERPPADNDEESSMVSHEPDVEYTEVVHPRSADPARVPLRKGTDTVYSELQNSPHAGFGGVCRAQRRTT